MSSHHNLGEDEDADGDPTPNYDYDEELGLNPTSPQKIEIPDFLRDNSESTGSKSNGKSSSHSSRKRDNSKKNKRKKPEIRPEVVINMDDVREGAKMRKRKLAEQVYEFGKDEPWNMGVQMMLLKISEKARGYRWMHTQQKKKLKTKDSRYSWLERVLLGFLGIVTGVVTLLDTVGARDNMATIWVTGALEIVLIFLYAIIKETHDYQEIPEKMYRNEQDARRFQEIHHEIQKQLALRTSDRRSDKEFLTQTIDKYNDTFYQAAILEDKIVSKYLKATKKRDITLPINFQDSGKINVYVSPDRDNRLEIESSEKEEKGKKLKFTDKLDFDKRYNYEMNRFFREL